MIILKMILSCVSLPCALSGNNMVTPVDMKKKTPQHCIECHNVNKETTEKSATLPDV
ncbi:hypothetical protein GDO81_005398 [Engystomops pustulosus]|uniref:Uncharacterized protein n=1 Tax=Engystomops pustulosus TaxID=76066 RepID=A0AAV7CNV4_ENGPU|nr:hypothetical protein GDO81_005398 [Engystomops pustulosus]